MPEQMQLPIAAPKTHRSGETRLKGLGISPGLGMGVARVFADILEVAGESYSIQESDIPGELERISRAVEKTNEELEQASRRVEEQFSPSLAGIFRAHQMLLQGLETSHQFENELRETLASAELVVSRVFRRWQNRFGSLDGENFQQRRDDVVDIGRKVLRHLEGDNNCPFKNLPGGHVLVFRRLLPSDVVPLSAAQVPALVVESLARGSHAALLTRSKSIPTVAGSPGLLDQIHAGDELLVDGYRGEIVIAPTPETRAEFEERLERFKRTRVRCEGLCREPARTLDGQRVQVHANVGAAEDIERALDNGADGVGLFRIEELYFTRELPPTEDELLRELRGMTAPLHDKPLTVRLLDMGGDKPVPFLRLPAEQNRLLGRRGVRLLLEYPDLARTELGALLRLSQEQPLSILVPMVTLEEDMKAMREMFHARCAELMISRPPPLGAMIETPAAALAVPSIARHADFLSVGTNDLAQYTLVAGRDDPTVDRYYQDDHASVLRLLQIVVSEGGNVPVTLCGELAGREDVLPRLLKMGFRSFSMSPPLIPGTKELIREFRLGSQSS